MAGTLADVWVGIRGRTTELGNDIKEGATPAAEEAGDEAGEGFSGGFMTNVRRMVTTMIATVGVFKVAEFVKSAIEGAELFEKQGRLTEAVLKSTGEVAGVTAEDIQTLTVKMSDLTAVHQDVIESGANVLLTFTNIRNEAGKGNDIFNQTLQAAVDVSAGLHQDLQPSIIQLGKALNDPITGMTTLRRVGISFTQSQIDQAKAMQKSGDLMGAQRLILAELSKEFGGAGAAAAGSSTKAKNSWHNFTVEIGEKLLPTVDSLANDFSQMIPTIAAVAGSIADVVGGVVAFVEGNKALSIGILAVVVGLGLLDTVMTTVKAIHEAWLVVTLAEDAALDANVIGIIVIAIAALVAGIVWVATKTQFFQTVWGAVWAFLKTIGEWFAGPFSNFFISAWHVIMVVFDAIKSAVMAVWDFIQPVIHFFAPLFESVFSLVVAIVKTAWAVITATIQVAVTIVRAIIEPWLSVLRVLWSAVWWAISGLFTLIWNAIVGTIRIVVPIISGIIGGWLNGFVSTWSSIWHVVWAVISEVWASIVFAVRSAISTVISIIDGVKVILSKVREYFNGLKDAASSGLASLISYVTGIPGRILSAIGDLGSLLYGAGKSLLDGLINGVKDAIGGLKSLLSGVTSLIPSWKGPEDKDEKLLWPAGQAIMRGLRGGISSEIPTLSTLLGGVTAAIPAMAGTNISNASSSTSSVTFSPTYNVAGGVDENALARATVARLLFALNTGAGR